MEDTRIIARQIVAMPMWVCASRGYQMAHGLPATVDELAQHACINFRHASGRIAEWEFKVDGQTRRHVPSARLTYNDSDLVLQAVLDGQGIAQMPGYLVRDALRTGALFSCLAQHAPDDRGHSICYLSRQHLPSRMRVFIDFMTGKIRDAKLQCPIGPAG